jgi:2-oxoglutarate dehydrogenase E2 component (dihydrolipoamide succinyltransferase)
MANQILVPALGESVTEATVSKWLKQVGEKVETDEPLVELETDKVNIEVPSPLSGILSSIKVKEGDSAVVGTLLGIVNEASSNNNKKLSKNEKVSHLKKKSSQKVTDNKKDIKTINVKTEAENSNGTLVLDTLASASAEAKKTEVIESNNEEATDSVSKVVEKKYIPPKTKKHLSPAVRKIVEEKKIDLSNIEGSAKDGRIAKGDLINLMGVAPEESKRKLTHGIEERVKMSKLRVTIAKRLKESQNSAAMLTTFNEVDMQNIIQTRKDYQEDFTKKYSIKLGFMSFFVKASVVALKNFPAVNAEIENDHIIYKNYYNISVAIGTDRGLVVPVLKKADELSFADIEKNIFLLSEKAKKGKISIDDLQGGTFTISNGGIYGSMLSTPILNPPQTGILGMHNIIERPVVKDGNITIRPIMYLALSYDHRIIDGKEAVSFLKTIKDCLEEPRRLFLDL